VLQDGGWQRRFGADLGWRWRPSVSLTLSGVQGEGSEREKRKFVGKLRRF